MSGAILEGIIALIWATIAIVLVVVAFLGGELIAAAVFLAVVFATPFIMNVVADKL
jgi:hypothetical protein